MVSLVSSVRSIIIVSGGSRLGSGGTGPQILPRPPPPIFRVITVHKLLNGQLDTDCSSARCCLPNDEGPGPTNIFS